jgi:hypothetical protein
MIMISDGDAASMKCNDDDERRRRMTGDEARIWVIRCRSTDAERDRSGGNVQRRHERDGNVMAMAMECPLMAV